MEKVIEIQVGEYRNVGYFDLNGVECDRDDTVIVESDRSIEFGRVVSEVQKPCKKSVDNLLGKVIRKATDGDLHQVDNNRMKAKDALNTCLRKITERKLPMHIVKNEYSFDSSKLIFFFTADGRVDFRNLVKDLARAFRVRIELKQIGVRDKAKIIGGYGVCGRELCCSSYMKGFHPLSIKMAKAQGLPLTPNRLSGVCGRIKCCMAYEFSVYRQYARNLPRMGEKIDTPDGRGRVIDVNILKKSVAVDVGDGKISRIAFSEAYQR